MRNALNRSYRDRYLTLNSRGFITSYSQSGRLRRFHVSNSTAQGGRQEHGDKQHESLMMRIFGSVV